MANVDCLQKIVVFLVVITITIFSFKIPITRLEFPLYRVVLDPGHGGKATIPKDEYGDRFDVLSMKYLDVYREGASYKDYHEHIYTYEIAKRVDALLQLLSPNGNFEKFYTILQKYTDKPVKRIYIQTFMSRGPSLNSHLIHKEPNAPYRLFDFISNDGTLKEGRISYINSIKPHLVVSIHFALNSSPYFRGMNAVIAAPYSILYKGLQYFQGTLTDRSFFYHSKYADWFTEDERKSGFFWYSNDVVMYFTGYRIKNDYSINTDAFRGYRYNMVQWAFSDPPGWAHIAKHHPPKTPYANNIQQFIPQNAFFTREQSKYEQYRRDGGFEGYGGDNLYASNEIIRFVLYNLYSKGIRHKDQRLAPPYISIWSVPLHINAINAFIEFGYLARPYTRTIINNHLDDVAEGIAVGIYSLFAGVEVTKKYPYTPYGKKIDLEKYKIDNDNDYFTIVR
ncbi:MAG TPA: N-acetylmuramoyl-L-alanine amidase [Spirochaetota bacterium]|nr:N-acetylmuramoyl-L-alanine amidase [Spirochaetota bacterium]